MHLKFTTNILISIEDDEQQLSNYPQHHQTPLTYKLLTTTSIGPSHFQGLPPHVCHISNEMRISVKCSRYVIETNNYPFLRYTSGYLMFLLRMMATSQNCCLMT